MSIAPPKQLIPLTPQQIAAALALELAVREIMPKETPGREPGEHVVEAPPNRTELMQRSMDVRELQELQTRIQTGDATPDDVTRYRELGDALALRRAEFHTASRTDGGTGVFAVGKTPVLGPVGSMLGVYRETDAKARMIIERNPVDVIERHADIETALSEMGVEGKQRGEAVVDEIRKTRDPLKVAVLVETLSELQQEYGGVDTRVLEKGDLVRTVDVQEGRGGGAKALRDRVEHKTVMAEHTAIEQGDLQGAAVQMTELKREAVTLGEALKQVDLLKEQAMGLALNGDLEGAQEKVVEMAIVSSSLPEEVSREAKEKVVEVPTNPNAILNAIEKADKVDAMGALKVIGKMDDIAKKARGRGIEADAADVFVEVMKIRKDFAKFGREESVSGLLENDFERALILKRLGEQAIMQEQSRERRRSRAA